MSARSNFAQLRESRKVEDTGDFNTEGRADLLWPNDSGIVNIRQDSRSPTG